MSLPENFLNPSKPDGEPKRCPHPDDYTAPARWQMSNGCFHVTEYCYECESRVGDWIPKASLSERGLEPDDLPIVGGVVSDEPCAVYGCKRVGVEDHHWAPQRLRDWFGDEYSGYPQTYLCRYHHDLWHRVVTPELKSPLVRVGDLVDFDASMTVREVVDSLRNKLIERVPSSSGGRADG